MTTTENGFLSFSIPFDHVSMSCNAKQCEPTVEKIFGLDAWPCETIQSFFFAYGLHDDQVAILMAMTVLSAGCSPALIQTAPTTMRAEAPASTGQPVNDGWQPNERLLPAPQSEYEGVHKLRASRQGLTPRGGLTVYSEGKGWIRDTEIVIAGGWDFTCKNYAMTDRRGCILLMRIAN